MTLTTHAVVGAAAASLFPHHPYAAFAAGFVSHLAIDALPHWDYNLRSLIRGDSKLKANLLSGRYALFDLMAIGFDLALGFVLTLCAAIFLNIPFWLALIGAGAGIYPDLLSFAYMKARVYAPRLALAYKPIQRFHVEFLQRFEWKGEGAGIGIALQAALVIIVLVVAKLI